MPSILTSQTSQPALYWRDGDEAGRKSSIAWHAQRHRTYRKAASLLGATLQTDDLTGDMTSDWFARHYFTHMALQRLFPQPGESIQTLAKGWSQDDDEAKSDWQHRHALIHARLDAAFGIVSK